MYTIPNIKKALISDGTIAAEEFDKHLKVSEQKGEDILQYLVGQKVIGEEQLYSLLAASVGKPFISLKDKAIRQDILFAIPEPIAKVHDVVAFEMGEHGELKVAAVDPDDIQIFEFIEKKNKVSVDVSLASPTSIHQALRLYHQSIETELQGLTKEAAGDSHGEELKKLAADLPVVRLVNSLLEFAIFEGASDIHIEPEEKELSIRYRVDGILRKVMTLPKHILSGIVARIKILSNLKLDEHRLPQDGRFKIEDENYRISFRVSTLPVFDGEKIVLRILDESSQQLKLEDLGFREKDMQKIIAGIGRPHGMILVTGPTGSGKTTTLYAILNRLNTPDVNISTIEDPIEYRMPRVNQSQVNPKIGFTFANGLRALLRQDPNIIMVGEIRDQETVDIAIQAAMTGHKVLSTLHTNDAPGTLPRLLDMGVVSFLIASTVHLVMAQRLVRKICQNCIMSYTLDKEAVNDLARKLDITAFVKLLQDEGLADAKDKNVQKLLFFKGKGCNKCGQSGYKGRMGIYEILEVTETVQKLIISKASTSEIMTAARSGGMTTMFEDGLIKAKNGVTTLEEILRVTKE
ncbi:MAG: type II/IV secretion system protein [Candidatus Jacksonbacteria bacterium]|nr:type II/IV secretion system protein [Candidatus Jacksonbacteria bacterium]